MFVFHLDILQLIGLALVGLFVLFLFVFVAIPSWYKKFVAWKKTGFCKHEWELYSTHSMGNYADFSCKNCDTKRVRRL